MTNEEREKQIQDILTHVKLDQTAMIDIVARAIIVIENQRDVESVVGILHEMFKMVGHRCKDIREFYMICGVVICLSDQHVGNALIESVMKEVKEKYKKTTYENN